MRILSGIQPTGAPHLGNYFAMMRPCLESQGEGQTFLFLADLHTLTTTPDAAELRRRTDDLAVAFLACGLDPSRTVFFRQSDVPQVTELAWVLSTLAPMGLLERCHSYKDKIANGLSPNVGLFTYPILMAADILLYHANRVPVGKDQKQHLEVARDIAIRFNNQYGETLTVPEPLIREEVAVVPGIDGRKMSKSYGNTIEIFEPDEKAARKKFMRVVTDSKAPEEPKDPDACNLFALYKLFATPERTEELRARYRAGGLMYGTVKQELFELYWSHFAPMRERRAALLADPAGVEAVLAGGAARARSAAAETMAAVRKAVGLR